MQEELIEMCRVCMDTKDGTKFFNIFEHFVNNELLVNLIHDLSSVLVELDDSAPYTCNACVSKLTKFQSLRAQIRESDRILKSAFNGGTQDTTIIMPEPDSHVADDISEFGLAKIKEEPLASRSDIESEAVLLGMKVEFLDSDTELLIQMADQTPRPKKGRKPPAKPDGFYCCMCPKTFQTKAEQLQHATTEHTKHRYAYQSAEMVEFEECDMCGKKFQNKQRLQNHQFRFTTYQQCYQCGEILPNNSTHVMQKHMTDHHSAGGNKKKTPKEPKFTCDICKKRFHAKKSLQIHMEEHSDNDFICPDCGKVKKTLTSFKNHMKLHELKKQEPTFACKFCPKKFYNVRRVEAHTRIHTGEKPFPCHYCHATFADLTDRRRHIWQHMGKSPYHCRYCDRMMLRNDQLQYHETRCDYRV